MYHKLKVHPISASLWNTRTKRTCLLWQGRQSEDFPQRDENNSCLLAITAKMRKPQVHYSLPSAKGARPALLLWGSLVVKNVTCYYLCMHGWYFANAAANKMHAGDAQWVLFARFVVSLIKNASGGFMIKRLRICIIRL